MENTFFSNYTQDLAAQFCAIDSTMLVSIAELISSIQKKSNKIIIVGNGGSAAIASHVSVDLTKAAKVRAINFNESDLITCFANDYGYENWIAEALKVYSDINDVVILISSSGQSKNILNAAHVAKKLGLTVITLSGFQESNPLRLIGDYNLWVNSSSYNVVEITHLSLLLSVIDYIIHKEKP